jgi:hypothetical protein
MLSDARTSHNREPGVVFSLLKVVVPSSFLGNSSANAGYKGTPTHPLRGFIALRMTDDFDKKRAFISHEVFWRAEFSSDSIFHHKNFI